jgi:AraC-like DNA-binding protein
LLEADATVGRVAHRVGYGSPFTFSTAFKRMYGVSPRTYRNRELATLEGGGPAAVSR